MRAGFYGDEAMRIQRGRDEVKVMVRYPEDERRSLGNIESMRIRTPGGDEVPFGRVATVEIGRGYATIERADRQRMVTVTGDVDQDVTNADEINGILRQEILPGLLAAHPGLRWSMEGEQKEQAESLGSLKRGFMLAILMIFVLLAVLFRSYTQPLIIMTAIPFGLVGAIWGHILMGLDLTLICMFGVVALTGVVVNDSLIMIDFINRARREGLDRARGGRRLGHAPLPAHHADLGDHLRRADAAAAGEEPAGQVPDAHGHQPGLRRGVRHLHHPDPDPGLVHPAVGPEAAAGHGRRGRDRRGGRVNRKTAPALLALLLLAGAVRAAEAPHPDLTGFWILNPKASDDPAELLGRAAEAGLPRGGSRDDHTDPNRETETRKREEAVAEGSQRIRQRISRLDVFTGGDEFSVSDGLDIFRLLHTDGRTETVWTDAGETTATAVWNGNALEVTAASGKSTRLTRFQLGPDGSQLLVMEQFTPSGSKEPVILRLVYDRQP